MACQTFRSDSDEICFFSEAPQDHSMSNISHSTLQSQIEPDMITDNDNEKHKNR